MTTTDPRSLCCALCDDHDRKAARTMRIILSADEGPTSRAYRRRVVAVAAVGLLAVMMGILAQFSQAGSAPSDVTPVDAPRNAPTEQTTHTRPKTLPAAFSSPAPRPAPVPGRDVAAPDAMTLGRADAPVVMTEYADFQCGYCTRFARETEPEIISRYVDTGVVRFEFRNFPIRGENSHALARAGWAAAQQGRFWQFHDAVYGSTTAGRALRVTGATVLEYARAAGVPDLTRFAVDADSPAARTAVDQQASDAVAAGAEMTPTFLINGTTLVGALPNQTFFDEIDRAAAAGRGAAGRGAADWNPFLPGRPVGPGPVEPGLLGRF